jgi:uncharacterized membrane protein YdjX (TVP38/TMEM64 family)
VKTSLLADWLRNHVNWLLGAVLLSVFLLLFLLVEALQVPILVDPIPTLAAMGPLAAIGEVGLLVADVVLPVPSSVVMIAHGALFEIVLGSLLSLLGGLGATLLAFSLGRRSRALLQPVIAPEHERHANALLTRYGPLAIVVTRPVPMVAETVAILAGRSTLSWHKAALAGAVGGLAPAILYGVAGAVAATAVNGVLVFGVMLLVSVMFWLLGRQVESRSAKSAAPESPKSRA